MIMCLKNSDGPADARGAYPRRRSGGGRPAPQGGPVFLPRRKLSPIARALLDDAAALPPARPERKVPVPA